MVKHISSKYGWHIYNRCFHDECRKQEKIKQLDVVCFDHKSWFYPTKTKLHVFCLAPKVSVFLLCFAKDISDSIFRTISCYHSLVNLFVEIMFTACFC